MTYRDLIRRSEHPRAGGGTHHVTNPAAGYLPGPRTRADEYDRSLCSAGPPPALPYAGTSPPSNTDTDWAIREWAVRVWAARDHGAPRHQDEPASTDAPPGDAGSTPVDWDLLDADSLDPGALEVRRGNNTPAHWLDADGLAHDDLAPVADDDLDDLDLSELADAVDEPVSAPPAPEKRPARTAREDRPIAAGPPPPQVYAAAILTAILSLPLLLSAGVLVAVSSQAGIAAILVLLLAVLAVVGAAGDVVAALRLADRGDPRLARTGGYVTLAGAVLSAGWLLLDGGAANVLFPIWASFGVLAVAMFALLGTGWCRDWLVAREWERRAAGERGRRR